MRTMPTTTHGRPIPALLATDFDAILAQIAGRALTEAERERVQRMSARNWTLRAQASELFGDDLVDSYFASPE